MILEKRDSYPIHRHRYGFIVNQYKVLIYSRLATRRCIFTSTSKTCTSLRWCASRFSPWSKVRRGTYALYVKHTHDCSEACVSETKLDFQSETMSFRQATTPVDASNAKPRQLSILTARCRRSTVAASPNDGDGGGCWSKAELKIDCCFW